MFIINITSFHVPLIICILLIMLLISTNYNIVQSTNYIEKLNTSTILFCLWHKTTNAYQIEITLFLCMIILIALDLI